MRLLLYILAFLMVPLLGFSQKAYRYRAILTKPIVGQIHVFGHLDADNEETHLTYLGKFHTSNKKGYHLVVSVSVAELTRKATPKLLVFNSNKQYQGSYSFSTIDDLPIAVENGVLKFKNTDACNSRSSLKIDLKKGLPKKLFLECRGGSGDFLYFKH